MIEHLHPPLPPPWSGPPAAMDFAVEHHLPSLPLLTKVVREGGVNRTLCWNAICGWQGPIVQFSASGMGAAWPGAAGVDPTGSPLLLPPGRALCWHVGHHPFTWGMAPQASQWNWVYVILTGPGADAAMLDLVKAHGHVLSFDPSDPLLAEVVGHLPDAGSSHRSLPLGASARMAVNVLAALHDANAATSTDHRLAQAAMEWLRARTDVACSVEQAAAAVGITREHLTRCFSSFIGMPPAAWHRHMRFARARALIEHEGLSVDAAAKRCGFHDLGSFIAGFRAMAGMTPGAWRRLWHGRRKAKGKRGGTDA